MDCQKLIQPLNAATITLVFTEFATESGYDFVRVYNGSTTSAPLLGQFSGNSLPPSVTATNGSMLITFTTDVGVVASGWSANYTGISEELMEIMKSTGINAETQAELILSAYPNPTSGTMTIETNYTGEETFYIELINAGGQRVMNQRLNVAGGKFEIDLSNYDLGFYLLKVRTSRSVQFIQVIKN
jgi:hypothetical protein